MRLLFDQNLSVRLVRFLADLYPGSTHTELLALDEAEDGVVWGYARRHGLITVSKDGDFYHRALRFGPPPKVVWLRLGNCPTGQIERLLRQYHRLIGDFADDPITALLAIE